MSNEKNDGNSAVSSGSRRNVLKAGATVAGALALGFSQRVTVMNQGEVLMAGTPAEVRADRRVQEIYTERERRL